MNALVAKRLKPKKPVERISRWKVVTGDSVSVISGKEKGQVGKIIKVNRKRNTVLLEGLNLVKKHVKSTEEFKGGIFTKEAPIHYSNIQLLDPLSKKPTKIGWKFTEDGTRVRYSKESGEIIPKPDSLLAYKERRKLRQDHPEKDTPPSVALKRTFVLPTIEDLD